MQRGTGSVEVLMNRFNFEPAGRDDVVAQTNGSPVHGIKMNRPVNLPDSPCLVTRAMGSQSEPLIMQRVIPLGDGAHFVEIYRLPLRELIAQFFTFRVIR